MAVVSVLNNPDRRRPVVRWFGFLVDSRRMLLTGKIEQLSTLMHLFVLPRSILFYGI
jgi:hypothetical protein